VGPRLEDAREIVWRPATLQKTLIEEGVAIEIKQ